MNDEIDRLAGQNADLEARLAGAPKSLSPLDALPSKEQVGKALDFAEDFMRRMMRVLREDDPSEHDRI